MNKKTDNEADRKNEQETVLINQGIQKRVYTGSDTGNSGGIDGSAHSAGNGKDH